MKNGYIYIDNTIYHSLLAISHEEQARGLMFVEPPTPIMSFIYNSPRINKFWMKSTPAPLDIVFCHNNKISQICYGKPFSTEIIGNDQESDLVIEFPYGTVNSSEIKIGQSVGLIKPSKMDLFKIKPNF